MTVSAAICLSGLTYPNDMWAGQLFLRRRQYGRITQRIDNVG